MNSEARKILRTIKKDGNCNHIDCYDAQDCPLTELCNVRIVDDEEIYNIVTSLLADEERNDRLVKISKTKLLKDEILDYNLKILN